MDLNACIPDVAIFLKTLTGLTFFNPTGDAAVLCKLLFNGSGSSHVDTDHSQELFIPVRR